MEWESLSHRVSRLEAGLGPDGPEMAMVGGDWSTGESFSDWIHYRLSSLEVRQARAGMAQGRAAVNLDSRGVDEDGEYEREGIGYAVVELPISEVGSWPVYTAVLQGFGIRTDVDQGAAKKDALNSSKFIPWANNAMTSGLHDKPPKEATMGG